MLEELRTAIIEGDPEVAVELTQKGIDENTAVLTIVNDGLVPAMDTVAAMWKDGEYFLSDVILCANAFGAAMELVTPILSASDAPISGKVVVGVVKGDMHDLGKNILVAMLRASGFRVLDIGVDKSVEEFVEAVKEEKPDILGVGAYMSTTMWQLKEVVDAIEAAGLRDGLKITVGGVCVTDKAAEIAGADAWGRDAMYTVELYKKFMGVA